MVSPELTTPKGGRLLDPFGGSGTHGAAAVLEGFLPTLIESDRGSVAIARHRIQWAVEQASKPVQLPL